MTTDPTHLAASEAAYDEGYGDAMIAAQRELRDTAADTRLDPLVDQALAGGIDNPYRRVFNDRLAYVREQVTNTHGDFYGPDDESVFDEAEFVGAILDAHADWLAGHPTPGTPANLATTLTAAAACARELRGNGPPPDSTEPADLLDDLARIVRDQQEQIDELRTSRDNWRDEAEHERAKPETPQAACGFTGIAAIASTGERATVQCALRAGHDGPHEDGPTGVRWVQMPAARQCDELLIGDTLGEPVRCIRTQGHDGRHLTPSEGR